MNKIIAIPLVLMSLNAFAGGDYEEPSVNPKIDVFTAKDYDLDGNFKGLADCDSKTAAKTEESGKTVAMTDEIARRLSLPDLSVVIEKMNSVAVEALKNQFPATTQENSKYLQVGNRWDRAGEIVDELKLKAIDPDPKISETVHVEEYGRRLLTIAGTIPDQDQGEMQVVCVNIGHQNIEHHLVAVECRSDKFVLKKLQYPYAKRMMDEEMSMNMPYLKNSRMIEMLRELESQKFKKVLPNRDTFACSISQNLY
jgi:hypothetical protein